MTTLTKNEALAQLDTITTKEGLLDLIKQVSAECSGDKTLLYGSDLGKTSNGAIIDIMDALTLRNMMRRPRGE